MQTVQLRRLVRVALRSRIEAAKEKALLRVMRLQQEIKTSLHGREARQEDIPSLEKIRDMEMATLTLNICKLEIKHGGLPEKLFRCLRNLQQ